MASGFAAPAADAGCGGVARGQAKIRLHQDFRAPLVIGDSILLGAIPEVNRQGFEVNTRGCRGWDEGVSLLRARRHAGTLPRLVVVMLGTNYSIRVGDVQRALRITGRRRVLAILTPREAGTGLGGQDARSVRAAARRWPGRVKALDWTRFTRKRGNWFGPDNIHLTDAGAVGLARYLRRRAAPFAKGLSRPRAREDASGRRQR